MEMPIKKAVLPVAGLGTRFLPITKTVPKEMLPVLDKPIIQYAVEEAIGAGIREIILVNHPDKQSIESYFNRDSSLEDELRSRNKKQLLDSIIAIPGDGIDIRSVYQNKSLGLGHAVLCARELVGNDSFAVILPDDLIAAEGKNCLQQMISVYERHHCGVIAVEKVPATETGSYGIVETSEIEPGVSEIHGIVEKPSPEEAPSTLAVVGRYLLPPSVFRFLEQTAKGAGGEIQLTDAIASLLQTEKVLAYEFSGKRYDCGNKLEYLKANIDYGLANNEISAQLREFLKEQ